MKCRIHLHFVALPYEDNEILRHFRNAESIYIALYNTRIVNADDPIIQFNGYLENAYWGMIVRAYHSESTHCCNLIVRRCRAHSYRGRGNLHKSAMRRPALAATADVIRLQRRPRPPSSLLTHPHHSTTTRHRCRWLCIFARENIVVGGGINHINSTFLKRAPRIWRALARLLLLFTTH